MDRKILAELQVDGRLTLSELADRVGLSVSPCHRRVKELEKSKAIVGYRTEISPEKVGLNFSALVFITIKEGVYQIGHSTSGFSFDNELGVHKTYLHQFKISNNLTTNAEYIAFIEAGGYTNFNLWHAEGWDFITKNNIIAPLYWHKVKGVWHYYTLNGFKPVEPNKPVTHISMYEAYAYAEWKQMRLPTEFEWEVAAEHLNYGELWEWTNSAYLPYPNFSKAPGALGEYNGKFMINQHVLRGASIATPENHSRKTYRNFFQADMRWLFSGIRLAQ